MDVRERTDQIYAMWSGELTHLEAWDDVTAEGLADRDRALLGLADEAVALDPTGEDERRLAETIAFSGRALVEQARYRETRSGSAPTWACCPSC